MRQEFDLEAKVETVGSKLRDLRLAKGLSLRAVSETAGVSVTWLCMENDKIGNPRVGNLRTLATFYSVPVATLVQVS